MAEINFYINSQGNIFDERRLEDAFLVVTGKERMTHEASYRKFRNRLSRETGLKEFHTTVEELIRRKESLYACKLYRAEHKCSLMEARNAVNELRKGFEPVSA